MKIQKILFFFSVMAIYTLMASCALFPAGKQEPEQVKETGANGSGLKTPAADDLPKQMREDMRARAGIKFPQDVFKEENACYRADLRTPRFGIEDIDEYIKDWENDFYEKAKAELEADCERGGENYFVLLDYETAATFGRVVSVLFSHSIYRGGAHPETVTTSMVFDTGNSQPLSLAGIFANPEGLARFLSDYTEKALRPSLGAIWDATPTFMDGFSPALSNFSAFMLTPEGLTLIFPAYQIAPYASGVQSCSVPLQELLRFMPRPGMWQ